MYSEMKFVYSAIQRPAKDRRSLTLVIAGFGLLRFSHVIRPRLPEEFATLFFALSFDGELGTEDVCQFGTVTISTAGNFFLLVVVIARRKQMAENHRRNKHLFLELK